MSNFVTFEVVSYTPAQQDPSGNGANIPARHNTFNMNIRPEYVVATNIVTETPVDTVKSIIFFDAESGVKPVLSTLTPEEVIAIVDQAG